MGKLFRQKPIRFTDFNENHEINKQWRRPAIDQTARVVCEECNKGWMSDLEQYRATPAITNLIQCDKQFNISDEQANDIAIFGFKTAVITDYMKRDREPFYSREVRHEFAKTLTIPESTQIWIAGFMSDTSGHLHSCYYEGDIEADNHVAIHVCTYSVGYLIFQVVSVKATYPIAFMPDAKFDSLPYRIWSPEMRVHPMVWPPPIVLATVQQWQDFSDRWKTISPITLP